MVVHAVRGKRSEYRPIKSALTSSVDPLEIATMFRAWGFDELYLADLDAIMGKQTDLKLYSAIAEKTGIKLMIDAGAAELEKVERILKAEASKVIIGTETLKDFEVIKKALKRFGSKKIVISLDLLGNKVLGEFSSSRLDPLTVISQLEEDGVERIIILDLARVGSEEGTNFELLESASDSSKLEIIAGGGIRDIKDLMELQKMGVAAVLLATSLHSGRITPEDLRLFGFLH